MNASGFRSVVFLVCLFVALVPLTSKHSTPQAQEKAKSRLERLVEELEKELVPYANDPSLDSLSVANPGEYDFDLVVLGDNNPIISDECYKLVLRHAAKRVMVDNPELSITDAMKLGVRHVHEERDHAREHGRTYREFFQHVAQCDQWCQPLVVGLEKCHIEAVAELDPWAVFFDFNSDVIRPEAEVTFTSVVKKLEENTEGKVLLIGRASRNGDKIYNRGLSYRRALAVRYTLLNLGVNPERIQLLWFGWEPPQISERVASAYGIGDVHALGGEFSANQSVVIVVY